jgi:hypothetical protein
MSEVKVNKLTPRTNCGTVTLGDSGDTFNIPSGVTIANNGTATGFGATGAVNWDTSAIKTVDFTATAGVGYFVDTATTGAVNVTLPASPTAGDVVGVSDYAQNFGTANCVLLRNGSLIAGTAVDSTIQTDGVAVTLVYVDATKGWIVTDSGNQDDAPTSKFVAATGGCITTCGNFKVHVFTSPGTFTVTCAGNPAGSAIIDYVVVAGGGGTNNDRCSGAGGGGFRLSNSAGCVPAPTMSPLVNPTGLTLPATAYPVTVGGGGAAVAASSTNPGDDSVFSTITAAGGGGATKTGGSGGGGRDSGTGSAGNTPPTSPPQGNPGGDAAGNYLTGTGGGGGAGAAGCNGAPTAGGAGGDGSFVGNTFIGPTAPSYGTPGPTPATRYFAGGGGGARYPAGTAGAGGAGGGGAAGVGGGGVGTSGTINTGGGGGGSGANGGTAPNGAGGGSGIVILRYKYQ